MNVQWIKTALLLSAAFFLMNAGMASAKPMPERPTWNDVRAELKKIKKHPKPVAIKKDMEKELKHKGPGAEAKPHPDPHKPVPVPKLDPKADKPKEKPVPKKNGHDKIKPKKDGHPDHPKGHKR